MRTAGPAAVMIGLLIRYDCGARWSCQPPVTGAPVPQCKDRDPRPWNPFTGCLHRICGPCRFL